MGKYHRFGRIAPMYPKSRLVKMAFSFVRNLRRCRCGRGPAYLLFFKRIVSGEESLWLLLVLFGDVCGCRLKLVDLTQLMAEIWAILRNVLNSFSKMTLNCGNAYGRTIPSQRVAWPFWSPTRGITCGGPLSRARSKTQRTQQRKAMPMAESSNERDRQHSERIRQRKSLLVMLRMLCSVRSGPRRAIRTHAPEKRCKSFDAKLKVVRRQKSIGLHLTAAAGPILLSASTIDQTCDLNGSLRSSPAAADVGTSISLSEGSSAMSQQNAGLRQVATG
ncbi:hypothetical protein ACVWW4_000368 [Bradyrhizobium sp. LB7.1]